MEIKAELNYLHIAPRKVRQVAGLIRGLDVRRAELELAHLPSRSAVPVLKLLRSAIMNAQHSFAVSDTEGLYIKKVTVNEGPVLKRMMPRAFGRGALITKRMSHIQIVLAAGKGVATVRTAVKKSGPIVRDVTAEDINEDVLPKKEVKEVKQVAKRRKPSDFVRRVFQRKAI